MSMEVKIYELPRYWISRTTLVSEGLAGEASKRPKPSPQTIGNFARCHGSILGRYVFCAHDDTELQEFQRLIHIDLDLRRSKRTSKIDQEAITKSARSTFESVQKHLIWEESFFDSLDMEALSPRDVNAHIRAKPAAQKPAPPPARLGREKDHPPPPPAEFQTELQIHSKMNHPNIVKFHRAFTYDKCTYIAMELCPNASLMDMVKKRKYLTEPEVRFYTVQIAGAVKYMHAKGIIHRDLKMGNIFLDKDMNVKIGDFGLAALLMSNKDMAACRRTTLCGTPNYIAPEILAKNNGGHDHAVDIWSLGIIIFAMLTGKPPFQSPTADEIYRRAKEREYEWPPQFIKANMISPETQDLVAMMLQDAEERPGPDVIVQHPFFTCGWMPQVEEMTTDLLEDAPRPDQFPSVAVKSGRPNPYVRALKKLCIKCEVGPWTPKKHHTSLYKECALEEKAGLTPHVPLAEDIVYRPYSEWVREQEKQNADEKSAIEIEASSTMVEPLAVSKNNNKNIVAQRPASQSFAAQQRVRDQPPNPTSLRGALPRRPNGKAAGTSTEQGEKVAMDIKPRGILKTKSVPQIAPEAEGRLAANLVEDLKKADEERKTEEMTEQLSPKKVVSLFGPNDESEWVPGTKPDHILESLRHLSAELERALNSRTTVANPKARPANPAIVVKWVDYTNRYGLGYILSNGSVGCVFRETPAGIYESSRTVIAPSCIVIRNGEKHLANRTNKEYVDRHQIIPVSGPAVEFFESKGERGIIRGTVPADHYKVAETSNGVPSRSLERGVDVFDDRKRDKICLWKKFGNYMSAYGRDQEYPYEPWTNQDPESSVNSTVVTFYQRWGDVGCWGFSDGHFQFNFPDHTKIVLSADGTWCDFYHLSFEAARELNEQGTLPATALDDRQHLSYPLQTLLNFMAKPSRTAKTTLRKRPEIDPMIQGLPQANDFRRKVEFIKLAVKEWVQNGGLGISDMEPKTRLRWLGRREANASHKKLKHVWTTVGGRQGDERRVGWFDPLKPEDIIYDSEINGVIVG
ncbi:serine threonine kinase protein [Rutstroemia sp. NJR-2017a BVV2]|nr:serine threonine kinase protein [Rutstroemia sp. NJR-2017a BVV2]PQE18467.1 serine threonine kinase protein [Rutstroemia sp. NJR-2017a BVV2]